MRGEKSIDVTLKALSNGLNADHSAQKRRGKSQNRSKSARETEDWFNDQLSRLYGETLNEPVPQPLLDLLQQLRCDKKSVT